jgi:hypothetical protein
MEGNQKRWKGLNKHMIFKKTYNILTNKSSKAVWITAIAPYIVLFILLIRGLTLEGSSQGISFYLTIKDWGSLLEMKVLFVKFFFQSFDRVN